MANYTMDRGPTREGCPYRCKFDWDVMSICPWCRRFRIEAIQQQDRERKQARAAKAQKDKQS